MIHHGPAIGGPLDTIKLTAMDSWDGKVQYPKKTESQASKFYPGHYVWYSSMGAWMWKQGEPEPSAIRMCSKDRHYFPLLTDGSRCRCGRKVRYRHLRKTE